jgi:toxin YhaV
MQVDGWELFAHPLLLDQLEKLMAAVEKLRAKKPDDYQSSANFKLLAALYELMFVTMLASMLIRRKQNSPAVVSAELG